MESIDIIPRDAIFTIGQASSILSSELTNQKRFVFVITNTSPSGQVITLGFGKEAVAGSGIILVPGAIYSESVDSYFKPTNAQITAISSASGGTISLHERIVKNY